MCAIPCRFCVDVALHWGNTHPGLLCVQRADLHGRAQDVLKRKLNVTLPELEMPEVLRCMAAQSMATPAPCNRVLHAWGSLRSRCCQAMIGSAAKSAS